MQLGTDIDLMSYFAGIFSWLIFLACMITAIVCTGGISFMPLK